ncbi:MAG: DUF4129 domain-containing protein [Candidatus Hydrogenedentes bacterium]|nr:DUF4129 domain-containing protein [Candidatus Hydrogenedentota bacterium]
MKRRTQGAPALEIIEESVHLLRTSPLYVLGAYYAGALPFVLALLYFWVDMSKGAYSEYRSVGGALGLAVLFAWMKTWQSVFGTLVRARLCDDSPPPWTVRRVGRVVVTQTILQSTGLLVLPAAMMTVLPYIWVQGWYQNVTVLGDGDDADLGKLCGRAYRQMKLWPRQCSALVWLLSPGLMVMAAALILVISPVAEATTPMWTSGLLSVYTMLFTALMVPFSPLGIMLAVNTGALIGQVPAILERVFGIENVLAMGWGIGDSTFYAIVCAIVYLILDPVQKTAYAMRCFQGESLQTGEDLKVGLRRIVRDAAQRGLQVLLVLGIGLLAFAAAPLAHAQETAVSPDDLSESIDRVLQQREYAWRLDREIDPNEEKSMLTVVMEWVEQKMSNMLRTVRGWLRSLWDWIRSWFPDRTGEAPDASWGRWRGAPLWTMYGLIAVLAIVLAIALFRAWQRRRLPTVEMEAQPVLQVPDIESEDVVADALPEDGWLALARELMEKGEWRLAMRAFFLAGLALLARNEMIRVAKYKSNREYLRELARRAHAEPEILDIFSKNVLLFERVWYGRHEAGPELVRTFDENQNRMRALAEKP